MQVSSGLMGLVVALAGVVAAVVELGLGFGARADFTAEFRIASPMTDGRMAFPLQSVTDTAA